MLKLAIDAGHGLHTPGKRVDKQLDKNQTREWVLNDRVARFIAQAAAQYGIQTLRVDDPTGKKDVSLAQRCRAANSWGADVYISCHHNAGIKLGTGGGMVAYCYKAGTTAADYRDAIYKACIAAGGLRGNRADPTPEKAFTVLKNTKMPAVLVEFGFMDSKTDAPVILTEDYAEAMGSAVAEAIAQVAGLKKQAQVSVTLPLLRRGHKGEPVRALQWLLTGRNCPCDADGSFGPKTEQAVENFRKMKKLPQDQCCDAPVWNSLLGGEDAL